MRRIFLSVLLMVPGILSGMAQEEAIETFFDMMNRHEVDMAPKNINKLDRLMRQVPDINAPDPYEKAPDGSYTRWTYDKSPLINLVMNSDSITICRMLIARGANINEIDTRSCGEEFPLFFFAACNERRNIMRLLLEVGVDYDSNQLKDCIQRWYSKPRFLFTEAVLEIMEEHREKVAGEVQLVLSRDTAGIVSEYVVGEKLTQAQT